MQLHIEYSLCKTYFEFCHFTIWLVFIPSLFSKARGAQRNRKHGCPTSSESFEKLPFLLFSLNNGNLKFMKLLGSSFQGNNDLPNFRRNSNPSSSKLPTITSLAPITNTIKIFNSLSAHISFLGRVLRYIYCRTDFASLNRMKVSA